MNISFKRPLFIGAHPDDICLGCGGLLSKLRGSEFYCYTFTSLNDERRSEWENAMDYVGPTMCELYKFKGDTLPDHRYEIRKILEQLKKEIKPDVVFTHSLTAIHQSHMALAEEVQRIMRFESLLGYNESKTNTQFKPTFFIELTKENIKDKLKALSYFKSENWKSFFHPELVRARVRVYGSMINVEYAEAFTVVRIR